MTVWFTSERGSSAAAAFRGRLRLTLLVFGFIGATAQPAILCPASAQAARPVRLTMLAHVSRHWPIESRTEPLELMPLVQENDDENEGAPDGVISSDQIAKYVAVYRAMQRNHSVTVEKAAASQGLTVPAFRDLERRIEKNDLARDQARRALAAPTGTATPKARP